MSVKNRATFVVMLIIFLISAISLGLQIKYKQDSFNEHIELDNSHAENIFSLLLAQLKNRLEFEGGKIIYNQEVTEALDKGDRERLYRATVPVYNILKADGIGIVGFIGADNIHFLRMQEPQRFGDNLSEKRKIIKDTNKFKKMFYGFDSTLYGLTFVATLPIYKTEANGHQKYLGFLNIGTNVSMFQKMINESLKAKSAIFFETSMVKRFDENSTKQRVGEYSLISYEDQLFKSFDQSFTFSKNEKLSINGRTYMAHSFDLPDYRGRNVAKIVFVRDITKEEQKVYDFIMHVAVVMLVMLLAAYFILKYSFEIMIEQVEDSRKKLKAQLFTDGLTGLANRLKLVDDLRQSKNPVVAIINIDGFKEVNDFFGNYIGDCVLKKVAEFLKELTEGAEQIYRLGADEFALLKESGKNGISAEYFDRILHNLEKKRYFCQEQELSMSFTMGVASKEQKSLECADIALKYGKKKRIQLVLYEDSMDIMKIYENNLKWTKKLKEAIAEDRIIVYLQPIVCEGMQVSSYECLVRMKEDGNIYSPQHFLEIAKKSRLYPQITRIVVRKAFALVREFDISVSINISAEDMINEETKSFIISMLFAFEKPQNITFEIVESEEIENYDIVASFIKDIKELGAKVAIDDFGSGYSNFEHILKLNTDYIKIDGSIIKNIESDRNSILIAETIVQFAKKLGVKTVAEYVHNKEVLDKIKEIGVDFAQGFYISEPACGLEGSTPKDKGL